MQKITFELRDGDKYIPLIALLKAVGVAESGSMAQEVVTAGLVRRNGETELRKRAKIVDGDVIEFEDYKIEVKSF
ncbi:MAG: RNA-binding S4 domain-containing protein [Bacteroidales bacterium]|nr:RNA-binding S4 domain-containing protein [Bacteroidales bacterium]